MISWSIQNGLKLTIKFEFTQIYRQAWVKYLYYLIIKTNYNITIPER